MKRGPRERLAALIDTVESMPITLGRWLLILAAIIVVRHFLEQVSGQLKTIYFLSYFIHYPLAYLAPMLGLLGTGDVEIYEKTGLSLRLKVADEGSLPSLLLGFDNQGYGTWDKELQRYSRKSKGFYLTMTRSWYGAFGSDLATSLGVNYSLEGEDEQSADAFFGLEQNFDESVSFLAEYSLGLDDREQDELYGEGNGWLDLALSWRISDSFSFKFILSDLLKNGVYPEGVEGHTKGESFGIERQLVISYGGSF